MNLLNKKMYKYKGEKIFYKNLFLKFIIMVIHMDFILFLK